MHGLIGGPVAITVNRFVHDIKDKASGNATVVEQLCNDRSDQVMFRGSAQIVRDAVMDNVESHNGMGGAGLRDPQATHNFAQLLLELISGEWRARVGLLA